jgi:hypothetical protein
MQIDARLKFLFVLPAAGLGALLVVASVAVALASNYRTPFNPSPEPKN